MALRDAHHTMPLAAAVERYLDEQVGLLVAGAAAVRRREADAIHDQRAAGRRLRSVLRTLGPALRTSRRTALITELDWFNSRMGSARDAEVVRDHLALLLHGLDDPGAGRHLLERATVHAEAEARQVDALYNDPRYTALTSLPTPLAPSLWRHPHRAPDDQIMIERLTRVGARMLTARGRAESAHRATDVELHRLRRRVKDARYGAETIRAADAEAPAVVASLRKAATLLGDLQDMVVVRQWLDSPGNAGLTAPQALLAAIAERRDSALARIDTAVNSALEDWCSWSGMDLQAPLPRQSTGATERMAP